MAAGKLALKARLLATEPIERRVDCFGCDVAEVERGSQPGARRQRGRAGGEFGGGFDEPGGDQRYVEIALALCGGNRPIDPDPASDCVRSGDWPCGSSRPGANDG
jgi:hypothetical protein